MAKYITDWDDLIEKGAKRVTDWTVESGRFDTLKIYQILSLEGMYYKFITEINDGGVVRLHSCIAVGNNLTEL